MTLNEFLVAVLPSLIVITLLLFWLLIKRKKISIDFFLFSSISILGNFLLYLPLRNNSFNFFDLKFNWEGKLIILFFSFLCLLFFQHKLPTNKIGLTFKQNKKSIKSSLLFILIYFSIITIGAIITKKLPSSLSNEAILWNFSVLPDFTEELFERGILLVLLNNFLKKRWRFLNLNVGVGFFIIILLFGLEHGFFIDETGDIGFHYVHFLRTTFMSGLAFTWLKEKTGSLLFPTILHAGSEVLLTVLILFLN